LALHVLEKNGPSSLLRAIHKL